MEGSTGVRSWLRCYRCWSQNLELQVHYEGIHRIDADTGERGEVIDEIQEAAVQCVDCMHDQPHLRFHNGRIEPVQDSWERMIAGAPWVASCTVTVDAEDVEACSGPDAGDVLSHASFGEHGTREFFSHVRFHKHDEDRIVVHLLVELYARSGEEATEVLEAAARGALAITSLAEESRPPAATSTDGASDPGGVAALPSRAREHPLEHKHESIGRYHRCCRAVLSGRTDAGHGSGVSSTVLATDSDVPIGTGEFETTPVAARAARRRQPVLRP